MCDTWVAMRSATRAGNIIFGKNSDRPIFDCQPLMFQARQKWLAHDLLHLEYIDLPQVEVTYAHLGSSPYWCWGYEEGINEYSVAIGNEALFTKSFRSAARQYEQGNPPALGLLGMDLVRLALERSQSAQQAVVLMGQLIEQHGLFGSGVPGKGHVAGGYDNAYIVADPNEAWVVETIDRRWVARRVSEDATSISNEPSIRAQWDLGSDDVNANAIANGWWPADANVPFDFARAYADEGVPRQVSHIRMMRTRSLLQQQRGRIDVTWMKRIARDHYEDTFLQGPAFDPADPDFHTICMHVSPAGFTWGNTASSCVAELPDSPDGLPVFWWTPGPPCNGCYVPFFAHGGCLPAIVSSAGAMGRQVRQPHLTGEDTFAPDSYWWLFRRLMDVVKGDVIRSVPGCYAERNPIVRARFDALEQQFAAALPDVMNAAMTARGQGDENAGAQLLDEFSARCVDQVVAALNELIEMFEVERVTRPHAGA